MLTKIESLPPNDKIDDRSAENLLRFLRVRKFDVEKAVLSTVHVAHFNRQHPEWITELTLEEISIFEGFFNVLTCPDHEGRVICVLRPAIGVKNLTPSVLRSNPNIIIKGQLWFFKRLCKNIRAQVCGVIIINTFEGFTIWDNITISRAQPISNQLATFHYIQNCVGFRMAGAYLFHEPFYVSWMWSVLKNVVSKKIRERLHFCGPNYDILNEILPDRNLIPKFLGGNYDTDQHNWVKEQYELEQMEKKVNSDVKG